MSLGFDAVGIAKPNNLGIAASHLRFFLDEGRHGTMAWMERNATRRENPLSLWPEVKSVIVVAMNYGPSAQPLKDVECLDRGTIATYARGSDYHEVMKKKLNKFGQWMIHNFQADIRLFVDTAPVLEKPIAQLAGIGWQGKHTNLVSSSFGSWLLLGEVFTNIDLNKDIPGTDFCGTCTRCLDVCPTKAFPNPYELDARRCISYLTIEYKGHIPTEFRKAIGNRIFGCDDCLAVCPWNKYAELANEASLKARNELNTPQLLELAFLDDKKFRVMFRGSPIKRTGRDCFVRNVLIAVGNSNKVELAFIPLKLLDDISPIVRAMAIWALARLDNNKFNAEKALRRFKEHDINVCAEWDLG